MDELNKKINGLKVSLDNLDSKLGLKSKLQRLNSLQEESYAADFWNNNIHAQIVMKEISEIDNKIKPLIEIRHEITDLEELLKTEDKDLEQDIKNSLNKLKSRVDKLQESIENAGPYDDHNVILSIYAGAGGVDAQDWAEMLQRMYLRWAEKNKYKANILDLSNGDEAGIKSVTIEIDGENTFGKLKGEKGVHRLVRLSPYNADHLRQTSFARVEILPKIEPKDEQIIDSKDLKIDVFRSGGHGGQSVNTTDSAVRVTHIPSGISVAIQNERSQLQNKDTAISILNSKLLQLSLEQHKQKIEDIKGPNQSAEWGNQIRNYVLHPYKQVKDLRTKYESKDPEDVLNGNINSFIEAYSKHKLPD